MGVDGYLKRDELSRGGFDDSDAVWMPVLGRPMRHLKKFIKTGAIGSRIERTSAAWSWGIVMQVAAKPKDLRTNAQRNNAQRNTVQRKPKAPMHGTPGTIVEGLSRSQISYRRSLGTITKITHGRYVWGRPTPNQMLKIVETCWPKAVFTGVTSLEIWQGKPVTYPLHVAIPRSTNIGKSEFFRVYRVSNAAYRHVGKYGDAGKYGDVGKLRVHVPLLAVRFLRHRTSAIKLLNLAYATKQGHSQYRTDREKVRRLPAATRHVLSDAAIGADSHPERVLTQALRAQGVRVRNNVKVGELHWDLQILRKGACDPLNRTGVVGPVRYQPGKPLPLLIEIDGLASHHSDKRDVFVGDRWKANLGLVRGHLVLRFTGSCIEHHLKTVVEFIVDLCHGRINHKALYCRPAYRWHLIASRFGF